MDAPPLNSVLGLLSWWLIWTFFVAIWVESTRRRGLAEVTIKEIALKGFMVAFVAYAFLFSLFTIVEGVLDAWTFLFG